MPQSTDLISSIQDQFIDIIEVYANYFVKLSAKNHSPKNITVAVFKANIENLEKFRIKELKKLNDKDIEKKFNPTSINYISRSLDVPRETIRRNILTLVDNSELIRSDEGLFVSEKFSHIILLYQ